MDTMMLKMKHFKFCWLLVFSFILTSCTSLDDVNKRLDTLEEDVSDIKTALQALQIAYDEGKVVKFYWCGDEECGKAIEEETGVDILGINEEDIETDKVCPHCGKPAKHLALMAKTY